MEKGTGKWKKFLAAAVSAVALLGCASGSPAGPLRLTVTPENRLILVPGPGDGTLQIQVFAPNGMVPADRPHLNLALVIDRSGSMSDARKLTYVKTAAHQLVDLLGPGDVLSIVAYDHEVTVPFPAAKVDCNRDRLHRIIDSLYPGGRTFLSGGLEEGFRQAREGRRSGSLSRVLLLSDGLANVGTVDRWQLRERAGVFAEKGISISTFGVGRDFDEDLLALLATGGGGNYRYLGDPEEIVAALRAELRLASSIAASEVEIIIRPRRGCRFGSVIGHEWRQEGDSSVIRLGDLSVGEKRTLFAGLRVEGVSPGKREVGEVALRWRDPRSSETVSTPFQAVDLELVEDPARWRSGFDADVQGRKAVVESSVLMQEAARFVDAGEAEKAKDVLKKSEEALRAAPACAQVSAQMEENRAYQEKLDSLGSMAPGEVKDTQKGVKYRSYQKLYQQ